MFDLKSPRKLLAVLAIAGSLGGAALVAHAQATAEAPPPPVAQSASSDRFFAHKQRALARIAAHVQVLQNLQSCMQAAVDRPGVRACHQAAHSALRHRN